MLPEPAPGLLLAKRYRVRSPLGVGGIGSVYRADDEVLRTSVAVKILKPDLSQDENILARFTREAKAMSELAHENIVQAHTYGRTPEGYIILVMELVEGETLRSTLNRLKPFALSLAVPIITQIGAALDRAHSLAVVHRDLKPENVMVSFVGDDAPPRVKVLDFGMAKILGGPLGSGTVLTRKGAVFGTPHYMSPEQAMGREVDARTDQYAFGVMVYEMLAGRRPFSASTALDVLQMQIHQAPPVLHETQPSIPAAASRVVARMLAKNPDDRFPDVASAVEAFLSSVGVRPSMTGPSQGALGVAEPKRWWQRLGSRRS